MVCMCGNHLDVWETFVCVGWFVCVTHGLYVWDGLDVWEWFGCVGPWFVCVRMVCMCGTMVWMCEMVCMCGNHPLDCVSDGLYV